MSGNVDEDRIIDEAIKQVSNDRVRIEDLKKMAEESTELIDRLSKHVLNEILEHVRNQTTWSVQRGAPSPDQIKIHFGVQTTILSFVNELLGKWQRVSSQAIGEENIRAMKDMLDRKK